jgi:hypothetical protein
MNIDILSKNSINNSKAICILGMHRSGTSTVTRIINLLGVYLGESDELYGQRYDNLEGFWERKDIVDFHDELLQSIYQRWDTALPLSDKWMHSESITEIRQRLRKIIVNAFSGHNIWAWKDPRTCIILPLWRELLTELNSHLSVVYIIRNPVDVANSLFKRNDFPFEKSYGIWLNYNISALKMLSDQQLLIVSYDQLLDSPQQKVSRLAEHLSIPYPSEDDNFNSELTSFLRQDLRHSHSAVDELRNAPQMVNELYHLLIGVAEDKITTNTAFFDKVAKMDRQFRESSDLFRHDMEIYFRNENHLIPKLKTKVDELELTFSASQHQIIEKDQQLVELKNQLSVLDKQISEQGKKISERDNQLSERDKRLVAVKKQLSEHDKQLVERGKQLAERGKQLAERGKQIAERGKQLAERGKQLAERDKQLAERGKQIVERGKQIAERDKRIIELKRQLTERDKQEIELKKQLSERDKKRIELKKQLSEQSVQLAEHNRQLAERDKQLAERDRQLAERDRHFSAQAKQLAERDRHLSAQAKQLAGRDKQLAERDKHIYERDKQFLEQHEELSDLLSKLFDQKEANIDLSAQIDVFLNSNSWKITKPFRAIRRFF